MVGQQSCDGEEWMCAKIETIQNRDKTRIHQNPVETKVTNNPTNKYIFLFSNYFDWVEQWSELKWIDRLIFDAETKKKNGEETNMRIDSLQIQSYFFVRVVSHTFLESFFLVLSAPGRSLNS